MQDGVGGGGASILGNQQCCTSLDAAGVQRKILTRWQGTLIDRNLRCYLANHEYGDVCSDIVSTFELKSCSKDESCLPKLVEVLFLRWSFIRCKSIRLRDYSPGNTQLSPRNRISDECQSPSCEETQTIEWCTSTVA